MRRFEDAASFSEAARRVRLAIVRGVATAKSSHLGSALSIVEILLALYGNVLRDIDGPPLRAERDRFVLSKAHAGIALYATLVEVGLLPPTVLDGYYVDGGTLPGHADATNVPWVELSAGSLGHGLTVATGMALFATRNAKPWRTFVLVSDGECDEGATWEAALLAAQHRLQSLTAIVDANGMQGLGRTSEIVDLEPLDDKWRAFGWDVAEIDGHDSLQLESALNRVGNGRPRVIIARTVKGKGVPFMENDNLWHYRSPSSTELEAALKALEG